MSVNRPQTISLAFAILTLFAPTVWGQQKGADIPVYESDNAIFGADTLSTEGMFLKAGLQEEIADVASAVAKRAISKNNGYDEIDSLFGPSSGSLVDKDGYFLPTADGEVWKEVIDARSARSAGAANNSAAIGLEGSAPGDFNQTALPLNDPNVFLSSKLRLRIGFDALFFERSGAENTVFTVNDNGGQVSFSDFDFTDGTARYFIQFMGDDQSGFEFTFFDFNSFSSSIVSTGQNVVPSFFRGQPATATSSATLNYSSRLKNVEINSWIRQNPIQRSGWGIRHINLDESFDVIVGGGLFSRTDNDLYGVTRMWERRRPLLNRFVLVGGLDAGLYLNSVTIDVDTDNVDDSSEADNIAGTLGFNLGAEYLVAEHVTLRCGYEGLGIFGVGLASTQSLEQELVNGLDDPELGSVYFGGFYIGAIAAF